MSRVSFRGRIQCERGSTSVARGDLTVYSVDTKVDEILAGDGQGVFSIDKFQSKALLGPSEQDATKEEFTLSYKLSSANKRTRME